MRKWRRCTGGTRKSSGGDREAALATIRADDEMLSSIPEELLQDDAFMRAAVAANPRALQLASDALRCGRAVVLEAARQDGLVFRFCQRALRADRALSCKQCRPTGARWGRRTNHCAATGTSCGKQRGALAERCCTL